jgi:hypothetical protein
MHDFRSRIGLLNDDPIIDRSGQDGVDGMGDQFGSVGADKPRNQRDLAVRAADFLPGDPYAVRGPDARLAVMRRQLIGCDDVFTVRDFTAGGVGIGVGVVPGVDDNRAIDFHRSLLAVPIKDDPASKAAHSRMIGPREHGVGPHGNQPRGRHRFLFVIERQTGEVHVELLAAGEEERCADNRHDKSSAREERCAPRQSPPFRRTVEPFSHTSKMCG